MIIFHEIGALQNHLSVQRKKGRRIGLVPTMGALHEGHISLIRQCMLAADFTVCSIFINPTQFNDPADFIKYPVTIEQDILLLLKEETDILFLPSVKEIYPSGIQSKQLYNLGYIETVLEGTHRPGHFQGVCQVVHRLLDIVEPGILLLGQKDYQQCMVLKKLVELLGLPVRIIIGETSREKNGLALSSRNLRLTPGQKEKATAIYRALIEIKSRMPGKTFGTLQSAVQDFLLQNGFAKVDYVAIADAATLEPCNLNQQWNGITPVVILIAAFMGEVRLIDNMLVTSSN